MATLTERENLLRVMHGQEPEWLPRSSMAVRSPDNNEDYPPSSITATPTIVERTILPNGNHVDIFGVEFEPTDSANGGALPVPGKFILDDISNWRDVIKLPSLEGLDWEGIAKKATENINRDESAVALGPPAGGLFQRLMSFMGFTNGLCALFEEPDEVCALNDYICTFYETVTNNIIDFVKPDIFNTSDDNATALNPFISTEMYRNIYKPYQARILKAAIDRGLPINIHDCGRCEDFIEDWLDMKISCWNPAQVCNDLSGIKKKYGNKMVLSGCWDSTGPVGWPGATEETIRQAVRDCIDAYAPGGGFIFGAGSLAAKDDPEGKQRSEWINDEYNKYGRDFYKRQG